MSKLSEMRVAVLATDGVEEVELTKPVEALRSAGARVEIISPKGQSIQAFQHLEKGAKIDSDLALKDAESGEYDALLLPGGAVNADTLHMIPEVQQFLRSFDAAGKPMAIICHAPWLLVSAGLVRGRRLTSYHTIQDDIRNAGGNWEDSEVVEDRNWVTSRQPKDLPAFIRSMTKLFEQSQEHSRQSATASAR